MLRAQQCVCVFFDMDKDICTARVAARKGHPTIPQGGGSRAVASHAKILQTPSTKEGFAKVHVVKSEEDSQSVASILAFSRC